MNAILLGYVGYVCQGIMSQVGGFWKILDEICINRGVNGGEKRIYRFSPQN